MTSKRPRLYHKFNLSKIFQLEVERLRTLWERAQKNGVPGIQLLKGEKEIKKVEPHCRGIEALWSPNTGLFNNYLT
jgi:L-2-hydroxyglutarate oxidase LhgO